MFRKPLLILCVMIFAGLLSAGDWPQWRGPFLNGSADETGLVGKWTPESNLKWQAELPGSGSCTPVVSKGLVFVSSTDKDSKDLLGMCFDAESGKELWRKVISKETRRIPRNGDQASPSASTDGERVYFTFENGVIAALDYSGELIWKRKLEEEYGSIFVKFGYSSTLLLFDGKMYVLVMRNPEISRGDWPKPLDSFILCIDPKTGKNIFKQQRQFTTLDESYDSYASAIPFVHEGRKEILVNAADHITGHDPETGTELWRYKYLPESIRWGRNIASVATGNGMIFGARARGTEVYAIKGGAEGEVFDKDLAWTFDGPSPDVCTPLYYRDKLYVLEGSKKKIITCLNSETGEVIWQGNLGGSTPWRASPTASDGKVYCISERGMVVVLDADADEYKELCKVDLDQKDCRGSIAIANKSLFIRTGSSLYCIGK